MPRPAPALTQGCLNLPVNLVLDDAHKLTYEHVRSPECLTRWGICALGQSLSFTGSGLAASQRRRTNSLAQEGADWHVVSPILTRRKAPSLSRSKAYEPLIAHLGGGRRKGF